MKYFIKHCKHSLILTITFLLSAACHAEGAGIRLNYGELVIYAYYNDNAHDKITGVDYIRKPSGLLFDLIKIIQDNKETLLNNKNSINIDIGNHNGYIMVEQEKPVYKTLVDFKKIKHLDNKSVLNTICQNLLNKTCTPHKDDKINLYLSTLILSAKSSDVIEFGCFPCSNDKNTGLTNRFKAQHKNEFPPEFKKVEVTRQTISRYFEKLSE